MSVAIELLDLLTRYAKKSPTPRVKALHLPHATLAGNKDGEFCALELDDGSIGLSYVLLDDTLTRLLSASAVTTVEGANALELAQGFVTRYGVERTLAFAAINALTRSMFDRAGYVPPTSADSIGGLDPGPGDHVGMIGYFKPLVARVVAAGARLTIVELKADLVGECDGFRVTLDAAELADCNKILSTSTVLLNDTLDGVLACCGAAQRFALIGPGAGCLPEPLFARGVSMLGGSWIVDSHAFVDALTNGRSWSQYARKVAIDADDYPGTMQLLSRIA